MITLMNQGDYGILLSRTNFHEVFCQIILFDRELNQLLRIIRLAPYFSLMRA